MMDSERLKAEKLVLEKKLPSNAYRFMDMDTDFPYIVMAAKTNRGNIYTLRIELDCFPEEKPEVYVTKKLYMKSGAPMPEYSPSMHTLGSKDGLTQICHYADSLWTPMVSIYKVYVKCRLWLEMYELHLQTGNNMDYYLNHME